MHCRSIWRHPLILPVKMSDVTMGDVHIDDRYKWKTLPTMRERGMDYPLLTWIVDRDFYENKFLRSAADWMIPKLPPPAYVTVAPDKVVLIKGGNNRYQAAKEIGYDSIDCFIFDYQLDAIKWARYLDHCDPLSNPDKPFLGLIEYK